MINVFSRLSVFVAAFFLIVIVGCQTNGPIAVKGAGTGDGQLTDHTVLFVDEGRSGISEARRLGQTFPSSDFVATGLYLAPGAEVTVDFCFTMQGAVFHVYSSEPIQGMRRNGILQKWNSSGEPKPYQAEEREDCSISVIIRKMGKSREDRSVLNLKAEPSKFPILNWVRQTTGIGNIN